MRPRIVILNAIACIGGMPVLSTAQSDPTAIRDYAIDLAANGVASGLIIPADALEQAKVRGFSKPTDATQAAFKSDLTSSLSAFNAKQGRFRAADRAGVVHVRSVDVPADVESALERSADTDGASDIPALYVIHTLVLPAITGRRAAGVGDVGVAEDPACPMYQPVRIPAGKTRPIDILDQVVRQVPGITWLVTYRAGGPDREFKIGLMCGNGSLMRTEVQ
jgi:hypothetical protein